MNMIAEMIAVPAEKAYPNECCGFVIRDKDGEVRLLECENVHEDPKNSFAISAKDTHSAYTSGNEILGVYHSHPDQSSELSETDILASEESKLTYYVLSFPQKELTMYKPLGASTELLDRRYVYGVFDCYTLARDYYAQRLGICFGPTRYEEKWWWKNEENESLYLRRMQSFGFSVVSDLKPNDLIGIQVVSDITNHLLVYLGDGEFMHHLTRRKSTLATYGGMWEKNTRYFLRHSSLL